MEGRCEYIESTVMDSQQGILSSMGIKWGASIFLLRIGTSGGLWWTWS